MGVVEKIAGEMRTPEGGSGWSGWRHRAALPDSFPLSCAMTESSMINVFIWKSILKARHNVDGMIVATRSNLMKEDAMPTFALLTKLATEEAREMRLREEHGKQWLTKVKASCPGVHWLSHYLVLGPHDFLDLYEAANEEEAAKVAMVSLSLGALSAETWTLLPYQRYVQLAKEV